MEGPRALRTGAPVHAKRLLFSKLRSRLRKTILFETWPLLGRPWGGPGDRDGHAQAAPCRAESGMATHRPMLPCTRNDYFLQKVRSRLRKTTKTTTFRHRPCQGEPLENRAGASLELTRAGRPKNIASRAGKMLINSAQLETGGPEGPQNRCSRACETTTFSKRYALAYVKRYYLKLGPCWDGPRAAQGIGTVMP